MSGDNEDMKSKTQLFKGFHQSDLFALFHILMKQKLSVIQMFDFLMDQIYIHHTDQLTGTPVRLIRVR